MSNDNSLLEQMRKSREIYEVSYMKFINDRKYHSSYAFCFYENEDGKYYNSRIKQKFKDNFIIYPVGNKKGVLKLLNKIRSSNLYENVCTMFFVDRDYDASLEGKDEDLFETPCYSVENLYVQKECLINILQSEFSLNKTDKDCKKCLKDFEDREREFNNIILEFNALIYLKRKKSDSNSNVSFGSIKTFHLAEIEIGIVSKATKYNETLNQIRDKLNFEEYEIEQAKSELIKKGDFSLNFRGKNQLDFFTKFIKCLKDLNKTGGYFSKKYNNVHIDITSNRLSILSQYAITPDSLKEFLNRHEAKFQRLKSTS